MKYKYLLLAAFLSFSTIYAQIPNNSFEDWIDPNTPQEWMPNNIASAWLTVSRSETASSGAYAARLEIKEFSGLPVFPYINTSFPVTQVHAGLNGYYQLHKTGENTMLSVVLLYYQGNNLVATGFADIEAAASEYTPFSVEINTHTNETPDSVQINIQVVPGEGTNYDIGSYALIDQLSFGPVTDVNDENNSPLEFALNQNYPNPFNPETIISWQSPESGRQTLKIFDLLGNEIATIVDEYREAGRHQAEFNGADLVSGVYIYQLKSGGYMHTRKMILIK